MAKLEKNKKQRRAFDWAKAAFRKYALRLAYDGERFGGLAMQKDEIEFLFPPAKTAADGGDGAPPGAVGGPPPPQPRGLRAAATAPSDVIRTVEGNLFGALKKAHLVKDVHSANFSRCGRTDKGVHAAENVVALDLRVEPNPWAPAEFDYPKVLNRLLPPEIRVTHAVAVPPDFDARHSCKGRMYKYFFICDPNELNVELMNEAAKHFVGEFNFFNFCKADPAIAHFRRTIIAADVVALPAGGGRGGPPMAVANFHGHAFLWHQIRCMMAVLFMVGRGLEPPAAVAALLDVDRNPTKPNYTMAPANGLVLYRCLYDDLAFGSDGPLAPPVITAPNNFAAFEDSLELLEQKKFVLHCLAASPQQPWRRRAPRPPPVPHRQLIGERKKGNDARPP